MKDSLEIKDLEEVSVDADLMSSWLGDAEIEMSPRLLYDLKTLLSHYASIIVPEKDVVVDYPVDGTPCADVGKQKVFIPMRPLSEGRIDHTISSIIHELHHIKYSADSDSLIFFLEKFIVACLSSIEVDSVKGKCSLMDKISSASQDTPPIPMVVTGNENQFYGDFIRTIAQDLMFMFNVFEDVRIDEKQPINLQKYRDKHEKWCYEKYCEYSASRGEYYDALFELIFHYKGFHVSELANASGLKKETVVNGDKMNYFSEVFECFGNLYRKQVARRWNEFKNETNSVIQEFLEQKHSENIPGDSQASPNEYFDDVFDSSDAPAEFIDGEENFKRLFDDFRSENGEYEKLKISSGLEAELNSFEYITVINCNEVIPSNLNGVEYDTLIVDCYV